MRVERYTLRVLLFPDGSEPVASITEEYEDGTYRVAPGVAVGPFDTWQEVIERAMLRLDKQLELW